MGVSNLHFVLPLKKPCFLLRLGGTVGAGASNLAGSLPQRQIIEHSQLVQLQEGAAHVRHV